MTTMGTYLSTLLSHTTGIHPFHPNAESCLNNLPLLKVLGVFKVSLVTKVLKVTRLVHLTLETAEGRFDGFTFSNVDLDLDGEGGGWIMKNNS